MTGSVILMSVDSIDKLTSTLNTVCDWSHNAPQLFYLNRYYQPTIPSSCSTAQLNAIYIN
jgi:hypothetical protein